MIAVKPKALLIDFDGTLVDTLPGLYAVYEEFLESRGHRSSRAEFNSFNGIALPTAVEALANRYQLEGTVAELQEAYMDQAKLIYTSSLPLFEGAEGVLQQAQADGVRMAIVTASPRFLVERWLKAQGLTGYFEAIITTEGLPAPKPDPAVYLKALQLLELEADSSLAVEDSHPGATAALRALIPTVVIGGGTAPSGLAPHQEERLVGCIGGWDEFGALLFQTV